MVIAKLFTPGRGLAQASCGEIFCPKQFGLFASLVNAIRTGTSPPSSNVVEVNVKVGSGSAAAWPMLIAQQLVSAIAPATNLLEPVEPATEPLPGIICLQTIVPAHPVRFQFATCFNTSAFCVRSNVHPCSPARAL